MVWVYFEVVVEVFIFVYMQEEGLFFILCFLGFWKDFCKIVRVR